METIGESIHFLNPKYYRLTIYGSFLNTSSVFIFLFCDELNYLNLNKFKIILLIYGLTVSLLSIKNVKKKYHHLEYARAINPKYCQHCENNDIPMIPITYMCPECKSTTKNESFRN